tara:strand:- start:257 stop:2188 length:1932 start_codon:yes stop_codon:yes gene_type:complete
MLNVFSFDPESRESVAANRLAAFAAECLPAINDSKEVFLNIFTSINCFNQRVKDVDLLITYADYREDNLLYRSNDGRLIHSFCSTIEVKNHSINDVSFAGQNCFVVYNKKPHNVTSQSNAQKNSFRTYLEQNTSVAQPWVNNLIWLTSVPDNELPNFGHNILGSTSKWINFLEKINYLTPRNRHKVETFRDKDSFESIRDLFGKEKNIAKIERKKLECMTEKILDRDKQKYANKLGNQLLIIRGRAGTGKTVRLLRVAYQVYEEYGSRVIFLTYNKALVADIKRLLQLQGVKNSIGGSGIEVRTIYSFMYQWLNLLGVLNSRANDFLPNYEHYKETALKLIDANEINSAKIKSIKTSESRDLEWDHILIDESQDWPETERDLLYKLYNPDNIVIADGKDQFVRSTEKIDWRLNMDKSRSQIINLSKGMRLKNDLCEAILDVAKEMEFKWDIEPVPEQRGGQLSIIFGNGLSRDFHNQIFQYASEGDNNPIDFLFCLPPHWVKRDQGEAQSKLAKQYIDWGVDVWDGVSDKFRSESPTRLSQYRIVQYDSCRGLEGWGVICMSLDKFYEYKVKQAIVSSSQSSELFFDEQAAKETFAKSWLMIPLTRAIDHLFIHIEDPNSYVGRIFRSLHEKSPNKVSITSVN